MTPTIRQHPDAATLVSFAAGGLADPLAAVIAAHAAMCPQCRGALADLDLLGSALLIGQAAKPAAGRKASAGRPPDAMDAKPRAAEPMIGDVTERLPAPLARVYGLTFETIPWKRLAPGVWQHRLALAEGATGDLRLLKIGPDRRMPDHGHGGAELTLVLDGAFSDVTGRYGVGDLQDVDDTIEHTPLADAATGCICLIASERPARFKGVISRMLQPLTGM